MTHMTGEKKAADAKATEADKKVARPKTASRAGAATDQKTSKKATTAPHPGRKTAADKATGQVAKTARNTVSDGAGKRKATGAREPEATKRSKSGRVITAKDRWRMISDNAYYRAERRGFEEGNSAQDWLAAEAEIDAELVRTNTVVKL
jgi:hypothetical protein